MELRICHLYPDVLNLYGDQGNIICMSRRLKSRGIDVSVSGVCIGDSCRLTDFDLFFIGGGQDFEQEVLLGDLASGRAADIRAAVDDGKTFLTICGGYQMMGTHYVTSDGVRCDFIGALDLYTVGRSERMIGNMMFKCSEQNGGSMMLITDYIDENGLPNLEAVMEYYGVTTENGVVIEGDSDHSFYGYPHYLVPDIKSHDITAPVMREGYSFIIPVAQGLKISENLRDTLTVTELFSTSDASYSKIDGYSITTYDKEENDIDGPFTVGVAITETISDTETGDNIETNIVWIPSSLFMEDTTNEYSSGANEDILLNSLSWMCDVESGISIHSKSLDSQYLSISGTAKSMLTAVFVFIVPTVMLGAGVFTVIARRRK